MNARLVAIVMLRILSVWWFVDAFNYLIEVPADVYGIVHYQMAHIQQTDSDRYLATQREMMLGMVLIKAVLFFVLGVVFMGFARPLARFFARGLEDGRPL